MKRRKTTVEAIRNWSVPKGKKKGASELILLAPPRNKRTLIKTSGLD